MIRETIVHKLLKRPYRLHVAVDEGTGPTVVLLHGIAATAMSYTYLIPKLLTNCRVVAIELLGFGASPQPNWKDYSLEDHADSVLATLRALKLRGPIILVGHSMGSLIATEIAVRKPALVSHLFLCSMPLYKTSHGKLSASSRRLDSAYERVYRYIVDNPATVLKRIEFAARYIPAAAGFELSASNWLPFERSLTHAIMGQHTLTRADQLHMPVDLLVGKLDPLVIKSYLKDFVNGHDNMRLTTVNGAHELNARYADVLAEKIIIASEELASNVAG